MARQKHQKIKIMIINDTLRNARGREKAISTQAFCGMLNNIDIPCDRRTLSDDISILIDYINENNEYDYRIICENNGKQNIYYSADKPSGGSLTLNYEERKLLLTALNSLKMTGNDNVSEIEALKNRLVECSDEKEREKLLDYSQDSDFLLDTIAAKILIDWINSLTFIKGSMSGNLIEKIIRLADSEDRNSLLNEQNNPLYSRKGGDEYTFYNIDEIFRAIDMQTKLTFRYFRLDENREKIYRHDGKMYKVEPLTLTPNDGHYYLICYDDTTINKIRTFRIDRMSDISRCDEANSIRATEFKKKIPSLTGQTFRMFSGELMSVTLEFDDKIIDNIYDKFGNDISITRINNNLCRITADIQLSPPFFGWLFQFGSSMRVVSPKEAVDRYKKICTETILFHCEENNQEE